MLKNWLLGFALFAVFSHLCPYGQHYIGHVDRTEWVELSRQDKLSVTRYAFWTFQQTRDDCSKAVVHFRIKGDDVVMCAECYECEL